ncbi:hypothetical protein [Methylobacter sp.]|uniref:hypothetical protein n=1 Tax=Methylobacter sp. TaxID=2051955 RepID=UPI003DA62DAA
MSSPIFAALLSFMSAVIVAVLGHFFSIKRKRRDELTELRLKAYADFINAASRLVAARRMGRIVDELDELAALNDAKTRICIYADAPVVKALVEFWKHGGTLEGEKEIIAFTRFCMRIRESLGNANSDLQSIDISNTLFKLEPATYSFKHASSHTPSDSAEIQDAS